MSNSTLTREDYERDKYCEYGTENPSIMNKPLWKYLVYNSEMNAWSIQKKFTGESESETESRNPIWCFNRFGQTTTFIPDGRLVLIGGEHEDWYDADFNIYNDVVVITHPHRIRRRYYESMVLGTTDPDNVIIYGYPKEIFPPTDFHTSTLVISDKGDQFIYIIGGTYSKLQTQVFRLDIKDFSIIEIETTGQKPEGGMFSHTAKLIIHEDGKHELSQIIEITHKDEGFHLNIDDMIWSRL